jgi:D-glycero-alpha-D-manno-heptose-7-phosphate kinase
MQAIRARAPIRLDLVGGWTDVPPFSAREGGAVVNLAINRYCYVTVRPREGGIFFYSADYDRRAEAERVADLPTGGGLELLRASAIVAFQEAVQAEDRPGEGLDLFVRCEIPPGSGTGSSASVGVAVAGALATFFGRPLSAHEAALQAIRAEREVLRIAGGTQDQYAAAYGGANYMTFLDPAASISPLRLTPAIVAELEKRLVLAYTGVSRVSGDIVSKVMGAYESGTPRTVDALRTMRRLADDVKVALLGGDMDRLGEALVENWRCQKDLHPSVTSAAIDDLYQRAVEAGAMGGKALGAGGGGCLLFLAQPDREHQVRRVLAEAGAQVLEFGLEWNGLQVWPAL